MCINPSHVWVSRGPGWEKQPVPCRQCWRCKKNRINDYTGRALCEASTSSHVCTLTLSYAPRTDLADKILHPRHFQLFMKMLRRAGHKVRYLVAGEYGELRGRAHFHAILFFSELVEPDNGSPLPGWNEAHLADPLASAPFSRHIPQKKRLHIREWPHGFVFADWTGDERAIRYVCKYLLADDKNRAWFSISKKPPLGAAWFAQKAERARELHVLPSSFQYAPPGGNPDRPVLLTGATRRDYLNAITQDPALKPRMSDWVLKTFEKHERARLMAFLESQPVEVLQQAFTDNRAAQEEQLRLLRVFKELREVDELHDRLSESSDGTLRRSGAQWVPNLERKSNG